MTYSDSESSADEETPVLGGSSNARHLKREAKSTTFTFLHFFGGGIYAPDASTYDPIDTLLNADDLEERNQLTQNWRDNRLNELGFVGVVSALLAGVLTSTGSWPDILPNGHQSPWPVRASWYCGIILSLFSILTAADQTVRLYRLSSHSDGNRKIRKLLAKSKRNKSGRRKPSTAQVYTWQMPVMFLTAATVCMIVGMFLHVWSATKHLTHEQWWSADTKVATTFTVVAVFSIFAFIAGQVTLYTFPDNSD
ncbi:hypothetical protein P280DRAFT_418070 [Massarina eburnea CBS 473.64]|uniref:Uncharacterized protein n=1 Tax=Massarina eburnea CBS 473.64 TaxID=1395130 RepID=A0A6A6SF33_9PLEO|nr:hypothetical protein P280DRAFT_418070 [Massarina eburnea CBS 473.64]